MCIANFSARQTLRECPDNKVPPLNRVSNLFMGSSLRSVCGTAEAHIHVGAGRTHQIRVDVSECDYTGVWLMMSAERNADLADITEEDIEEGALNDDQLQALWGRTLEEAQNEEFVEIVAAWLDAPRKTVIIDAAKTLYEALRTHDAIMVSEPDRDGLIRG